MNTRTDTTRLKAAVDLREVAARYTTLTRKTAKEMEGPCPRCGHKDCFTVSQHMWFCRKCAPANEGGGRRDVLNFLQWVGAAHDFHDAVRWLESYTGQSAATAQPCSAAVAAAQAAVTKSAQHWSDPTWQATAQAAVAKAERVLVADTELRGFRYLHQRGIDLVTAQAWRVGAGTAWHEASQAPGKSEFSLLLPWMVDDQVTAIEARLLQPIVDRYGKTHRYTRLKFPPTKGGYAGECVLATGPRRRSDVLIVCEGYLNALACWQAGYDAATFGSKESIGRPATMQAIGELSAGYDGLICWADEPGDALTLQAELGGLAATSPHGCDAADLALTGHLGGLLDWLAEQALQEKVRP